MVKCCNHERSGRFCSECGKPLENGPLWDLVVICRKNESMLRTEARKRRKKDMEKLAETSERRADTWRVRGDALAEILKGSTGN